MKHKPALLIAALAFGIVLWQVVSPSMAATQGAKGAEPELLELSGDLRVHDPVLTKAGDTYYVFATGGGRNGQGIIPVHTSKDMHHWQLAGYALNKLPDWVAQEVPKARGAWAPDISFYNGKYHLYYAVSSFGSITSAIGLATNATLDSSSPDYKWVDEGMVVRSRPESTDWNAIDPNLVIEDENNVWLVWGSFWSGIQLHRIDPKTGKFSMADTRFYPLSSRDRNPPTRGSVEAPFIFRHDGWWYLFVSFDFCCRGAKSTYKVAVGRSRDIKGPYLDQTGKSMTEGGGTIIVKADTKDWHGAGHEAVYSEDGVDYLAFHAYPTEGGSQLQISTIAWEDGWPRVAQLP